MREVIIALLVVAFALPACETPREKTEEEDGPELQLIVQQFHREMRWQKWESAAKLVAEERRQSFLGRYEELGDDYRISNLEVKSVDREDDRAIVDVEEESYTEPQMTVEKKRIIEIWKNGDNGWVLDDRMPRDEYRERFKGEN